LTHDFRAGFSYVLAECAPNLRQRTKTRWNRQQNSNDFRKIRKRGRSLRSEQSRHFDLFRLATKRGGSRPGIWGMAAAADPGGYLQAGDARPWANPPLACVIIEWTIWGETNRWAGAVMDRERAGPRIKSAIQARQWEAYIPPAPNPTVQVSQMLLSNLGANDRKWTIETLAIAALNEKLPDGFKDESPKAAVLQNEIPFQVMKTGFDTKGFLIFHDNQLWFSSASFI
jgi:hypothetical protein